MKKISKEAKENIEIIKLATGNSPDTATRTIKIGLKHISYIYFESVSSDDKISNFIMKSISDDVKYNKTETFFTSLLKRLENTIPNSKLTTANDFDSIFYYLSSGFTCIFVDGSNEAIILETRTKLDRGVTESTSEPVIRGPKDSFTENHNMNLGLIRKRIKDPNLWFKEVTVGRRSKTKVAIAYIKDIVELKRVNDIEKKLKQIDIDAILDSGYIRKFLEGKQRSTFPQMITTEKPDMVCGELLDGKLAIIVENTPFVLITPATLISFLHAPTDYYEKASNVTFSRILRTLAFFITIITPALYIALTTFNHELIPDEFLISIAMQQQGVPFPTVIEVLLFGITFEVLRESDLRAPSAAGTAISIVGALVLGEAAVSAGVVSAVVVIIVAVTSICEMAFSDIDMINALRSWKIIFIFTSMFMGLIGFLVAMLILIIKLVSLETLDVPYLAPFSPIDIRAWKDSIIKFPVNRLTKRPRYLTDKNQTRLKEDK